MTIVIEGIGPHLRCIWLLRSKTQLLHYFRRVLPEPRRRAIDARSILRPKEAGVQNFDLLLEKTWNGYRQLHLARLQMRLPRNIRDVPNDACSHADRVQKGLPFLGRTRRECIRDGYPQRFGMFNS